MSTQSTISNDLLKLENDWALEQITLDMKTLDAEIAALAAKRDVMKKKMTELEIEARRLNYAIFEEEHGITPYDLIADYKKLLATCVSYKTGDNRTKLTLQSHGEIFGFVNPLLVFNSVEDWKKCQMTSLEVKAAKVLKIYKPVCYDQPL